MWFNKKVPMWGFILWLAMQNKLNTLDRLLIWGVVPDANCVQRKNGSSESHHNHLFFRCSYAKVVWMNILRRNQVARSSLLGSFCIRLARVLRKLSLSTLSAAVYNILCERYRRIFSATVN